ncbi:MAG: arylsulfatase A-like enzyme [Rhodothermales bacterium]|jgi:arylsulfatase A-like enzyme
MFRLLLFLIPFFFYGRPTHPNIVLILTDDLGWQDVGCYDIGKPCPYETPQIDQLAREGVLFWQAYSPAPTCAPSRASILSGKHPARLQKTHVVGGAPPAPYVTNSPLMSPWYSGRMPTSEITIAEALKEAGYKTGHVGKWHAAINHRAFPGPSDQGFDFTRMSIGATKKMPNRLADFASSAETDPFRLDENGFPFHQNSEDALEFLRTVEDKPFFLYYATWLVHTPIHTRSEALLRKYCKKMKVPFPSNPKTWKIPGQKNPYYAAMVESLDYYIGQLLSHFKETDDPRWPGHKLVENTYIIFSSDNGGMETHPGEIITDNAPLDKGKINAREGGVRVPLIIKGPGIPAGAQSQAMVNGLDFYPSILSWTRTPRPPTQDLDGANLASYLTGKLADIAKIGPGRDTMVWHFPHASMQSTIRQGKFKLIRRWQDALLNRPALELFDLDADIAEAKNLAGAMPEKARQMDQLLEKNLRAMKASQPYLNPTCKAKFPGKDSVCTPLNRGRDGNRVWLNFRENGARVVRGQLIYTDNGGHKYEEWYRAEAKLKGKRLEAQLSAGATHYVFNLIDENHFLVSHPRMKLETDRSAPFSARAIAVE